MRLATAGCESSAKCQQPHAQKPIGVIADGCR
jgi:hypothetical protein